MRNLIIVILVLGFYKGYGQTWNQIAKINSSNRSELDLFGTSVAISGNFAVVGSPLDDKKADPGTPNGIKDGGAAYVFQKNNFGKWILMQRLTASDISDHDHFGYSVDISGKLIIVGAEDEDHDSQGNHYLNKSGSAYIFQHDISTGWSEVQKITSKRRVQGDAFGGAVAISSNFALAGSIGYDGDSTGGRTFVKDAGGAFLFKRDSSNKWTQIDVLEANDKDAIDWFGSAVSLSDDFAVVAAKYEDHDTSNNNPMPSAGAAYIFERSGIESWKLDQKIVPSDRDTADFFGISVDLDDDQVIVGSWQEDEDANGGATLVGSGSAYIYKRASSGIWFEEQKIVASDRKSGNYFGWSVSISEQKVAVGSFGETVAALPRAHQQAGSAYIFKKSISGIWHEEQKLIPKKRENQDHFGFSIGISQEDVIVGAEREDENQWEMDSLYEAGTAYIFDSYTIVGVKNQSLNQHYKIYPNPSTGKIMVDFGTSKSSGTVIIRNANMQVVAKYKFHKEIKKIISINQSAGLYIMEIKEENSLPTYSRVVKY